MRSCHHPMIHPCGNDKAFQGHHLPVPQKPLRTLAAVRLARGGRTMCVFSQDVVDRNGAIWISWNILRGLQTISIYIYIIKLYVYIYIYTLFYFQYWRSNNSYFVSTIVILFDLILQPAQVLGVPLESIYLKSSELDSGTWWTMGSPMGWKLDGNPLFGNGMEMHKTILLDKQSLLKIRSNDWFLSNRILNHKGLPKAHFFSFRDVDERGKIYTIYTSPPKKTMGFL